VEDKNKKKMSSFFAIVPIPAQPVDAALAPALGKKK
jgi:hypothetical protein